MCNRYRNDKAIATLFEDFSQVELFADDGHSRGRNEPFLTEFFPSYAAPIITRDPEAGLRLEEALWGMPTPPQFLKTKTGKPMSYDPGVTNVRNTNSPHWRRWLGVEHRCLVPFTSFSEPDAAHKLHWFDFVGDAPPVACFAGITDTLSRQIKARDPEPTSGRFYAFLTTEPNAVVGPVHAKAMPVILTTPEDCRIWLSAPWEIAKALQRPLPDQILRLMSEA
ncbi:SOS response-associated peptidase family protein [Asticcacaulis sp. BYS171W]|uniref:Abasic site processing protein n=1 Tax=Asticcacaulis aquaticus TaxID=2984212 RepID=A0ABT5HUX9_9CAUL|nr:SOS response-associated peptidase family protein [Asticcacaulis aquaticus]MDC7683256.1 SOS response-associated peptidase family protein [Asticcacaulis aquaticus]